MALVVVALAQQTAAPPQAGLQRNAQASATQAPTASQAQPQPASQPGTAAVLKVKTRLVIVDVVALDHKGVPVSDLKAEDFTLQEEGNEQKISVFSFQQGGLQQGNQAQGQPAALVPAALPAGRITNMPRFKTNSTLNVLLLDGINVTSTNQKYTREQMLKFLEKLPAGQPLAVYALGSEAAHAAGFYERPHAAERGGQESQRQRDGRAY